MSTCQTTEAWESHRKAVLWQCGSLNTFWSNRTADFCLALCRSALHAVLQCCGVKDDDCGFCVFHYSIGCGFGLCKCRAGFPPSHHGCLLPRAVFGWILQSSYLNLLWVVRIKLVFQIKWQERGQDRDQMLPILVGRQLDFKCGVFLLNAENISMTCLCQTPKCKIRYIDEINVS